MKTRQQQTLILKIKKEKKLQFKKHFSFLITVCVFCVCVCVHVPQTTCKGQRTTSCSQFFLSTFIEVPGVQLRVQGLHSMCLCLLSQTSHWPQVSHFNTFSRDKVIIPNFSILEQILCLLLKIPTKLLTLQDYRTIMPICKNK